MSPAEVAPSRVRPSPTKAVAWGALVAAAFVALHLRALAPTLGPDAAEPCERPPLELVRSAGQRLDVRAAHGGDGERAELPLELLLRASTRWDADMIDTRTPESESLRTAARTHRAASELESPSLPGRALLVRPR